MLLTTVFNVFFVLVFAKLCQNKSDFFKATWIWFSILCILRHWIIMMIGSQNVCFTLVDITVNMFYFSINKWRFSFALKYVGSWKPLEVIIFIVKHPLEWNICFLCQNCCPAWKQIRKWEVYFFFIIGNLWFIHLFSCTWKRIYQNQ